MKRRWINLLFVILSIGFSTVFVFAEEPAIELDVANGAIVIEEGSYTQDGKTNPYSGEFVIKGNAGDAETAVKNIVVKSGHPKITLSDLTLDMSFSAAAAVDILPGAMAQLALTGRNTLYGGNTFAGVQVPEGAAVEILGDGLLAVRGGMTTDTGAAGIGAPAGGSAGEITIRSGTIEASGGRFSAAIGGGDGLYGMDLPESGEAKPEDIVGIAGNGGVIAITGGEITATAGYKGAGIGGGYAGNGGKITISGGTVKVLSSNNGAGIGGGYAGSGGQITILGGEVQSLCNFAGAGVGGGDLGSGGEIRIKGGTIDAASDTDGAAIGGGKGGAGGNIVIEGGEIEAVSQLYGAGIGGGSGASGGHIEILGGTINAAGGTYGAGIGGGRNGDGGEILIRGGSVYAKAGRNASAFGGGEGGKSEPLTNGEVPVTLVNIQDEVSEVQAEDVGIRSVEYPYYAYYGKGHGTKDLYFYLPSETAETERIYAIHTGEGQPEGTVSVPEALTSIAGTAFAAAGAEVKLSIQPAEGCRAENLHVVLGTSDSGDTSEVSVSGSNSFTMPDSDVTVFVDFAEGAETDYKMILPWIIVAAALCIVVSKVNRKNKGV
ncbi:hypothetical protein AGMMS49983_06310 [Clostridia bacterium]|nr:hypothetical protein AGMMS49983_06310 [Clostridia bacterium]